MRLLAIDACDAAPSAALAIDGAIVATGAGSAGPGAAESLPLVADEVALRGGAGLIGIDVIAVTSGPGGFTGMRVGVATARALALATGRPVLALTVPEVLAHAALAAGHVGPLTVVLEAGRGEVIAQDFGSSAWDAAPWRVLPLAELARLADRAAILVGNSTARFPAGSGTIAPVPAGPLAAHLARAAWAALDRGVEPVPGPTVQPAYHRPPDARLGAGAPLLARAAA